MTQIPHSLYMAAQSRELDRIAIEDFGIPGYTLMRRAAQATFQFMCSKWPQAVKVGIICGPGNNGGDGFVIAQLAKSAGLEVRVYLVGSIERVKGDAAKALKDLQGNGIEPEIYVGQALSAQDLIVDALFGTGLDRKVEGLPLQAIEAINTQSCPVMAVDIPSGLHADSGHILGCCVKAQATLSLIGLKQGLFTGSGPEVCGQISFDDLQVPQAAYQRLTPSAHILDIKKLKARNLPTRARNTHKGCFGHVVVVGGDRGMAGAVCLAALSAYRSGAGLVTIATHPDHAAAINARYPEIIVRAITDENDLSSICQLASSLVLGPGLGQSSWSKKIFKSAIITQGSKVVDADGLNFLANNPSIDQQWVLTPHPGEAGRLLGISTTDVQKDRFSACRAIVDRFGGGCVLKGAGSLVYSGNEDMQVCIQGNPGMASAGMGDCLAGLIGGLLAQGLAEHAAAALATGVHALAGDMEAVRGQRGMLASDLLPHFRHILNERV